MPARDRAAAGTALPRSTRCLVLAEAANPEWASVPLEGWSHASALARLCDVHLVTQLRNREAIARAGWPENRITIIDSEALAAPMHRWAERLGGRGGRSWTTRTAATALSYFYFERLVWQELGARIRAREFDVVHRITPVSPTVASPLARRCASAGVPFVLGPLNGGVPWPREFDAARRREREWLTYVRGVYRLLPGYRATRRHAAAIVCGSRDTLEQMPRWCRARCVYIPENAVDPERFPHAGAPEERQFAPPLRVVFVGRLVPYKGADMLLDASSALLRAGRMTLDIVGDGPERAVLQALAQQAGSPQGVQFHGWVDHRQVRQLLLGAHVLGFPSIREFGGAVVLEAMAMGVVPLVVAYGGPAELVTPESGIAVPLGPRARIVEGFRGHLSRLADDPGCLRERSRAARSRVAESFTWGAKARQVLDVYSWVRGQQTKPDFGMPLP